jgi:hypothetical protein
LDVYDASRSDDIEPTTPFVPGYRGDRGWGFRYLNLTRAMIRLYRAKTPGSTLLALASPEAGQSVSGGNLHVEWSAAGKPVESYTLSLDGRGVARAIHADAYDLPLGNVLPGRHTLTLIANGTVTRFPISGADVDRDLVAPRSVVVSAEFLKAAPQ